MEANTINDIPCPYTSLKLLNGLGFGNDEEMTELNKRIENLIDDPSIRVFVEQ